MPFFNWLKSKSENRDNPSATARNPGLKPKDIAPANSEDKCTEPSQSTKLEEKTALEPSGIAPGNLLSEAPMIALGTEQMISVPLGAFYDKLPKEVIINNAVDLRRLVQIAKEDLLIGESDRSAAIPLSILSLSCPEIFARPIGANEDQPIILSLDYQPPAPTKMEATAKPSSDDPKASLREEWMSSNLRLGLNSIFLNFPYDLATPEIREVSQTEPWIEVPLSLIQPQLASGRVIVTTAKLRELLPTDLKERLNGIDPAVEIPIPLQEIFKHLPSEAIQRRQDQEIEQVPVTIATPFTLQAREDAARFGSAPTKPSELLSELPLVEAPLASEAPEPQPQAPETLAEQNLLNPLSSERLQAIFMTDKTLDLHGAIEQVGKLPGLRGCLLSHQNGRKLTGQLGDPEQESVVSNLLPVLFQQISDRISETKFGSLETVTFYCDRQQLSTFMQGQLCLTVLHENRPFKPGVREKIQTVINEIIQLNAF
jgi:hypothetical protein